MRLGLRELLVLKVQQEPKEQQELRELLELKVALVQQVIKVLLV